MAYFALKYQLNKDKDYQTLWDELARLGAHKVIRSFWFLDLNLEAASEVRDHFTQFIDSDDTLCVVPMPQRPATYRCAQGTKEWLDERY